MRYFPNLCVEILLFNITKSHLAFCKLQFGGKHLETPFFLAQKCKRSSWVVPWSSYLLSILEFSFLVLQCNCCNSRLLRIRAPWTLVQHRKKGDMCTFPSLYCVGELRNTCHSLNPPPPNLGHYKQGKGTVPCAAAWSLCRGWGIGLIHSVWCSWVSKWPRPLKSYSIRSGL